MSFRNWLDRSLIAVIGGGAVLLGGGAAIAVAEPATPTPAPTPAPAPAPAPPNCTAADLAVVSSGVTHNTSQYLFAHPEVNDFFTSLKGQPKDQMRTQVEQYAEANPQVKTDLQGLRQPMVDFRARCG
jgi:heme-binding protein